MEIFQAFKRKENRNNYTRFVVQLEVLRACVLYWQGKLGIYLNWSWIINGKMA